MRLKDKVAVITGAASGIGSAAAELFAEEGAKVVVVDINSEAGQEVVQKIKKAGGEATFVQVDVSRAADNKRMVETAINSYGKLDILFNNAAIAGEALEELNEEEWHKVLDVNLTGPFLGCLYAIPEMKRQGGGNIINTSSRGGVAAFGRSVAYGTSKAGVIMLTKALARSLAKDNIRVNCLCPGSVDTGLSDAFIRYPKTEEERQARRAALIARIPLGRTADPKEIAYAALFLASDESSFVDGVALLIDGGVSA